MSAPRSDYDSLCGNSARRWIGSGSFQHTNNLLHILHTEAGSNHWTPRHHLIPTGENDNLSFGQAYYRGIR